MGKSTVIQSLLLLRQSMIKNGELGGLKINGEYISLGSGQDILYEKAEDEKISLGYEENGKSFFWDFQYISESDFLPVLDKKDNEYESVEYLASWHMRFTVIPGRIFFIPQYKDDKILVCYIGKKLKNVSYPT